MGIPLFLDLTLARRPPTLGPDPGSEPVGEMGDVGESGIGIPGPGFVFDLGFGFTIEMDFGRVARGIGGGRTPPEGGGCC